jgi:molybdenum cofactor cytidylyltransferase
MTIDGMPSAIVPGAGAATRFGGDKLIADVGGVRMLERTVRSLLDGGADQVVVVLAPEASWTALIPSLSDDRVRTVTNPDPGRGMFSSIQLGVRAVTEFPAAILPGDMPFVRPQTIEKLFTAGRRSRAIITPRYDGTRGHPVVLPVDVQDALVDAPATARLDELLAAQPQWKLEVDLDDPGILRDVDTKDDLAS